MADAARRIGCARWSGRFAPLIARAVCTVLLGASVQQAALGQAFTGAQRVEFEAPVPGGGAQMLFGHAYTPSGAPTGARLPAVVILHGSVGASEAREGFWGRELAALGMIVLVVDSFAPRGVASTVDDQTRVTTGQLVADAFGALEFLSRQNFVDPSRVAVMGMAKGGGAALLAADRRAQAGGRAFSAYALLYPFCSSQYRSPQPSGPMLLMIGDADDYTGVKPCADYAERLRSAGGKVELKTYKGAHHGFDGDGAVTRLAAAQNFRDCVMVLEDDGRSVLEKTGEVLDTPQKALAALKRSCMRTGASVGANAQARQLALADVTAFLKATILRP